MAIRITFKSIFFLFIAIIIFYKLWLSYYHLTLNGLVKCKHYYLSVRPKIKNQESKNKRRWKYTWMCFHKLSTQINMCKQWTHVHPRKHRAGSHQRASTIIHSCFSVQTAETKASDGIHTASPQLLRRDFFFFLNNSLGEISRSHIRAQR